MLARHNICAEQVENRVSESGGVQKFVTAGRIYPMFPMHKNQDTYTSSHRHGRKNHRYVAGRSVSIASKPNVDQHPVPPYATSVIS